MIASRSRGTPRIANRLLRRVRDYAQIHGDSRVDVPATSAALALFEVDESGLDRLDRAVLTALVANFSRWSRWAFHPGGGRGGGGRDRGDRV